jgi:hypothetical protein
MAFSSDTLTARFIVTFLPRPFAIVAIQCAVVCGCLFGAWSSWRLAYADRLFQEASVASLRKAVLVEPDAAEYYVRLAQLEDDHPPQLLETALRLNPYNAPVAEELGLHYEEEGDFVKAERELLLAFEVDRTWVPRWTLANFYFRRGDVSKFWIWARQAAQMPSEDMGALFQLCWRLSPDPEEIAQKVVNVRPDVLHQYLVFLLGKKQWKSSVAIAHRLMVVGSPSQDREVLFSAINQLIAAGEPLKSKDVWNDLIQRNWEVADRSIPNNGNFAREPVPVDFDWHMYSFPGMQSWPGPAGLETEFTGEEPESCTIVEQKAVLKPGDYVLEFSYRTDNSPPGSGIRWQVVDVMSGKTIAESEFLGSETAKQDTFQFSVSPQQTLIGIQLAYGRPLGKTRIKGTLVITSIGIKART